MDKDDTQKDSDFDVWETTADILGKHGKTDNEIKEMLEYHFPISSAIMDKILEARKKDMQGDFEEKSDAKYGTMFYCRRSNMILLIMGCALIGTVLLIGLCCPLSAANIPSDLRFIVV